MKRRTALGLSAAVPTSTLLTAGPAGADGGGGVRVTGLRVDGRPGRPLGLDTAKPLLSWRFAERRRLARLRSARLPSARPRSARLPWAGLLWARLL
ncbi:hypothetical protein [Actinoplanes philippinensis]|uniref:hypothetical protein n=1 Tax=Actinoplanes philippinensis TaxID=35752 RepID=UPI00340BF966